MEKNCAIFENFNPDKVDLDKSESSFKKYESCFPETPKIGNHYSSLGNRIITKENKYLYFNALGGCGYKNIKEINNFDLINLLNWAVETNTPNFKRDIFTLDWFSASKSKNVSKTIIGSIAGDIIGSTYEFQNTKD